VHVSLLVINGPDIVADGLQTAAEMSWIDFAQNYGYT
jgi:hypothetical protein